MTDHYRLLQVRRDASQQVIAAAYRRLMRDMHPDHGGDAEAARLLNEAYQTLSDPASRASYDRALPPEPHTRYRPLGPEIAYRFGRSVGRLVRIARREAV
ncbi:MAG: J domain-containing protein [Coriobacteriia bacterium]|nr:J domain-containing protein [Coriobacteriia bacterium]